MLQAFSARSFLALLLVGAALPGHALAADDPRVAELEARVAALEARLATLTAGREAAAPVSAAVTADEPVRAQAANSAFPSIRLRGRLQIDALAINSGGGATPTGTEVRRFYLGAEGELSPRLRFQAEADLAGDEVAIQDALIGYRASDATELVAGYFKPPITADDMTSDVYTLFLERSAYAGVFAPGRRIGLGVNHAGPGWGVRSGIFGERDSSPLNGDRGEAWLVSGRGHADLLPGDPVLHVALSAYYVEPSPTDDGVSLGQRPETNRALTAVDTGPFEADHGFFLGAEAGLGAGPFTAQLEGGTLGYSGLTANPRFWGYSAQLSWRITGEPRPYDVRSGVFGRVEPRRPIDEDGLGAIEAGARLTHVDLTDDLITGGELTTYSAVLNWYPLPRLRLAANYIHAVTRKPTMPKLRQHLVTLRGAIDW